MSGDIVEDVSPEEGSSKIVRALAAISAGVLTSVLAFPVISGTLFHTHGATKSAELEWKARERAVAEAVESQDAASERKEEKKNLSE